MSYDVRTPSPVSLVFGGILFIVLLTAVLILASSPRTGRIETGVVYETCPDCGRPKPAGPGDKNPDCPDCPGRRDSGGSPDRRH